jgi:hypothetical protein
MFPYEHLIGEPLFYLFVAFSFLLGLGYFWGKRINNRLFLSAFNDLVEVVKPVDQKFTNIGGLIGHHANLLPPKQAPAERVDATITFLPRQAWLWMPISKLIRKYDRLFITIHLRREPVKEGHLIEKGYARFRGPKITNEERLRKEAITWGGREFWLYYENNAIRDHLLRFVRDQETPGELRHIAVVPDQKKCFVFLIPRMGEVARTFGPVYRWIPGILKEERSPAPGKRKADKGDP